MSIGENIKKCRKTKGLTQQILAEKATISRSYLADVERNRYNPSIDVLQLIATALGITAQQLFKEDIEKEDNIDKLETEINQKIKNISKADKEKILKMIELFEMEK